MTISTKMTTERLSTNKARFDLWLNGLGPSLGLNPLSYHPPFFQGSKIQSSEISHVDGLGQLESNASLPAG